MSDTTFQRKQYALERKRDLNTAVIRLVKLEDTVKGIRRSSFNRHNLKGIDIYTIHSSLFDEIKVLKITIDELCRLIREDLE